MPSSPGLGVAGSPAGDLHRRSGLREPPADVRLRADLGAVNAVRFTALATLGAILDNLVASLAGGVEVTLSDLTALIGQMACRISAP
jgi:Transmembrane domain of unknown function (DUF3566)